MRFTGYLKELKENSFAIPVYTDEGEFYFHNVDDDYKIIGFNKAEISNLCINECYLSITFNINDFGAYVFIGKKNYINYNKLSNSIYEVEKYLKESTDKDKFLAIKEEVDILKSTIDKKSTITKRKFKITKRTGLEKRADFKIILPELEKTHRLNSRRQTHNDSIEQKFIQFLEEKNIINSILRNDVNLRGEFITYLMGQYITLDSKREAISNLGTIIYSTEQKKCLKEHNYMFKISNTNLESLFKKSDFLHNTSDNVNISEEILKKMFENEK